MWKPYFAETRKPLSEEVIELLVDCDLLDLEEMEKGEEKRAKKEAKKKKEKEKQKEVEGDNDEEEEDEEEVKTEPIYRYIRGGSCFKDFLARNYDNPKKIKKALDRKAESGEDRTVLEYLKGDDDDDDDDMLYYSFCNKKMLSEECDTHCSPCGRCFTWRFWHCNNCNRCSYGQTISTCQNCGHSTNRGDKKTCKTSPSSWGFKTADGEVDDEEEDPRLKELGYISESDDEDVEWRDPEPASGDIKKDIMMTMLGFSLAEQIGDDDGEGLPSGCTSQ